MPSFKISDYETRTFLLLAFITIPAWGTVNEDKKETYPYLFDAIEDVTVSIVGNSGTVETRTVSFNDFQTEIFDVSRYAAGNYSLLITTPRGTCLSGNFK